MNTFLIAGEEKKRQEIARHRVDMPTGCQLHT